MVRLEKGNSHDNAVARLKKHVIQKIRQGKNVYVFYPFKRGNAKVDSMEACIYHIALECGLFPDEFTAYSADTADSKRRHFADVNNSWRKQRLVFTNTAITVGVSFTIEHFDCVFVGQVLFTNGRDVIQNTYRPRILKEQTIYTIALPSQSNTSESCQKIIHDPVLKQLEADINFELLCPANFKVLSEKAGYLTRTEEDQPIDFEISDQKDTIYDWNNTPVIDRDESCYRKSKIM